MSDGVPDTILTQCPMHRKTVRVTVTCADCPHFHSVGRINSDDRVPWTERHIVYCGYRRVLPVSELMTDG